MASRLALNVSRPDFGGAFDRHVRQLEPRIERALLLATDRAAVRAKAQVRLAMSGAGLGRLGNAFDATSDLRKGNAAYRTGAGFSASGIVFVRTRSERTIGTLKAYTEGATIRPRRGRWLWIPTPAVQRVVGGGKARERVTPESYARQGLDRRIGPLVMLKGLDGRPLLAVKDAGVRENSQSQRVRGRTKTGKLRKGDRNRPLTVMFVAIPATSRAARVDLDGIMRSAAATMPTLIAQALGGR